MRERASEERANETTSDRKTARMNCVYKNFKALSSSYYMAISSLPRFSALVAKRRSLGIMLGMALVALDSAAPLWLVAEKNPPSLHCSLLALALARLCELAGRGVFPPHAPPRPAPTK